MKIYKKLLTLILASIMVLCSFVFNVYANNDYSVTFDSKEIVLKTPVINLNGRLMYPFRDCLEAMGADVEWENDTRTAIGTLNGVTIRYKIGSQSYTVNGIVKYLDNGVEPFIEGDRTYIPIRATAEGLGFDVGYDQNTRTASITTKDKVINDITVKDTDYEKMNINTYYLNQYNVIAVPIYPTIVKYKNETLVSIDEITDAIESEYFDIEINKTGDEYKLKVYCPDKMFEYYESNVTLGDTKIVQANIPHRGSKVERLDSSNTLAVEPIEVDGKLMIPMKNLANIIPVGASAYPSNNLIVFEKLPFMLTGEIFKERSITEYYFKPNNLYNEKNEKFIKNLKYTNMDVETYYLEDEQGVAIPISTKVVKVDNQIYVTISEIMKAFSNDDEGVYAEKGVDVYTIRSDNKYKDYIHFSSRVVIGDTSLNRYDQVGYYLDSPNEYYNKTFEYPPIEVDGNLMLPIEMLAHVMPIQTINYPNSNMLVFQKTEFMNNHKSLLDFDVKVSTDIPSNIGNKVDSNKDDVNKDDVNKDDSNIDESKYISVSGTKINLGESLNSVTSKLGNADRSAKSAYGFEWHYYNTDDYVDFIMVGIDNDKVVAIYSNSKNFKTAKGSYGESSSTNTAEEQYFIDENNKNRVYGVLIKGPYYGSRSDEEYLETSSKEIFDITNAFRVANGKTPLLTDKSSDIAAKKHSDDLAENDYFSHTGLDGSTPAVRYERISGSKDYTGWGENITAGNYTGIDAVDSWINSSGHRENMLRNYTHLGVGFGYDSNSTYKYYGTQLFLKK